MGNTKKKTMLSFHDEQRNASDCNVKPFVGDIDESMGQEFCYFTLLSTSCQLFRASSHHFGCEMSTLDTLINVRT